MTAFSNSDFLPGTYVLKVQFSNGLFALFTLSIAPAPAQVGCGTNAPMIQSVNASSPPFVVGTRVALSATVTDPDLLTCGSAESFTYAWKFLTMPAGSQAFFPAPLAAQPSFFPDLPGSYVIEVIVTDSTLRTVQATVLVIVAVGP
jgi:hypothetical protein